MSAHRFWQGALSLSVALAVAAPVRADPAGTPTPPASGPYGSAYASGRNSLAPNGPFGNTVLVTHDDGSWVKFYVDADGTYAAKREDGISLKGLWTATGPESARITCFTQTSPPPPAGDQPACFAGARARSVGDSFTATDQAGRRVRVAIVAGR